MKTHDNTTPRRKFLKGTAAVALSGLASDKILGANDRIRLGAIGVSPTRSSSPSATSTSLTCCARRPKTACKT